MVIDTSALLAVLFSEPDADLFAEAIDRAPVRLMSVVSVLEATMTIQSRFGADSVPDLDAAILASAIEIVPLSAEHLALCRHASERYGKGRHPARLNLGDCCAYATAMLAGEPLLFKGADFAQTDVKSAI